MTRYILIAAMALGLGACAIDDFIDGAAAIKAAQCAKSIEERQREWEATGRRVTPLDCTGPDGVPDGFPDFGPNAIPE